MDWYGLENDADHSNDGCISDLDVNEVADDDDLQRQQPDEVGVNERVVEAVDVVGQQVDDLARRRLRQGARTHAHDLVMETVPTELNKDCINMRMTQL